MFHATEDSLINATTRVWPVGVEVWPSVVVLAMNVIVMVFAFGISSFADRGALIVVMTVGYFLKYSVVKKLKDWYTLLLILTTLCTKGIFIMDAILLKTRPINTLPLSKVSCILAAATHRFEHTTICQSHVLPQSQSLINRTGPSIVR
jgi:hypothetical protein